MTGGPVDWLGIHKRVPSTLPGHILVKDHQHFLGEQILEADGRTHCLSSQACLLRGTLFSLTLLLRGSPASVSVNTYVISVGIVRSYASGYHF